MKTLLSAVSFFSILRGVYPPEFICKIAKDLGYTSIAITDCNNLYALPAFIHSCNEYELDYIIAAELFDSNGFSVLIYAEGNNGFSNLCRIISEFHCDKKFRLTDSVLKNPSGLHLVTDSISLIKQIGDKCSLYYRMKRPKKPPEQILVEKIPCIIAPPMVFSDTEDYAIHRLLRAIDCNTTISRLAEKELFPHDSLFLTWNRLEEWFEAFDYAIKSTEQFAKNLHSRKNFGAPLMPRLNSDESSKQILRRKTGEGALYRYGTINEVVKKRIDYELELIEKKEFSDYFLVVEDIVKQSPRTCGRGSGAASIVAYSLGITNVDPIRYNLMFERFLNPGRIDPPDIDVDFAWDERDDVLEYVFDKYGNGHVAMVATHLTCGARMAIREIARIYGLTESEISTVTGKIPYFLDLPENVENLLEVFKQWPGLRDIPLDPPWPEIIEKSFRIIGMPRGIGTHCGGIVVTEQPINTIAPIQISAKGYPIVQWEKDGSEEMGLVKIDLLGNRSLAVIRDAIANIKNEGITFDEKNWDPQSDSKTVTLLAEGRSMGVFYVESPAMRLLQRKTRVGDFEHLVIHSSIIRPAANKYIREYVRRLHGGSYTLLHPKLGDILSETFGIMVYQEDVSKVAMALASFSVEDADILRKIMSKKSKTRKFNDYKEMFFTGARKNGVEDTVIQEVWQMMLSFSGYSFCKPHSASYVQVSFQSAYLKAHFSAAFMAAVLSNYGGYYSTQAYINEAMRLKCTIVPPDVNRSNYRYYSHGNCIIVGFCQIKGLSSTAQDSIIKERSAHGNFKHIEDFLSRTGISESDAEKIILSGACDSLSLNVNRSQQFWQMRRYYRSFSNGTIPELQSLSVRQYLQHQYRMLGFLTCCHPITLIHCRQKNRIKAVDIDRMTGKFVSILGWCITAKTVSTKLGASMEFVTFEDETGLIETVFFPDVYQKYASLLEYHSAFVVSGMIIEEFGVATLEVKKLERP